MKQGKTYRAVLKLLQIALVVLLLIYPLFMDIMTAFGWLVNAQSYGRAFKTYAGVTAVCALLMAAGTVLYFCKKDLAAIVCDVLGFGPMMAVLWRVVHIAETNGWGGQTEASFGLRAAPLWSGRMWPTVFPFALLLLLSLLHYFSCDAVSARHARRAAREAHENRPAPKIIED